MIITQKQHNYLNEPGINSFVNRILKSIKDNLGQEEIDMKLLRELIEEAFSKYDINKETDVENYCLLYFNFPEMQKKPLSAEIKILLKSKTKPVQQKIDQLTEYLIFNSKQ